MFWLVCSGCFGGGVFCVRVEIFLFFSRGRGGGGCRKAKKKKRKKNSLFLLITTHIPRHAVAPVDRAHHKDPARLPQVPAPVRAQQRQERLRHHQRRDEVDLELAAERLRGKKGHGVRPDVDSGVVDEAGQHPAGPQDRRYFGGGLRHGVGVADVEHERGEEGAALPATRAAAADGALELFGVRGLAHGPEDVVPFSGQAARDGRADTARDARDDDGAIEALERRRGVAERVADCGKGRRGGGVGGGGGVVVSCSSSSEEGDANGSGVGLPSFFLFFCE